MATYDFPALLNQHNATTLVYGAGDDNIEVEGAIYEEFLVYFDGDEPVYLTFSNGVVLRCSYDMNGMWRFSPVAGQNNVVIVFVDADNDEGHYSDFAYITGPAPKWAALAKSVVFAR
jgi:hypothetical protein